MLVDLYNYFCTTPEITDKLIGSNYLSATYKCPINVEDFTFWNEMHLITYVISGRKDWYCGEEKHEMHPGQAVFIKKGVYTTKQYLDVEHCIVAFMLNDDFIRKFLAEYPDLVLPAAKDTSGQSIYPIHVSAGIESVIYSVAGYLKEGREIPVALVEIKFRELLFNLVLNPKNSALAKYFLSIRNESNTDLQEVMEKNFNHDLSLEEFARLCGRSLSSFKRDFSEAFKQTPGKWLISRRLDHARSLLAGSNLNINEICFDCGFKNSSHFNKAFKERFHLPPLQYRQSLSKN